MPIKISTLLAKNTVVLNDASPVLGGNLSTNGFSIVNDSSPVTITGNSYPLTTGTPGQVLTTNGSGFLYWQDISTGSITLIGDVSGAGTSTINTALSNTTVIPGTYGTSSSVSVFSVSSQGRLTFASSSPISITPSQAGLGNVTNSLQVINAGGTPSIKEGTGVPIGPESEGALYIDRSVTNGNSIYYYNGTSWVSIAIRPNLYNEKVNGFVVPTASALDSVALGSGAETQLGADNSLAIGMQSLSRIPGGVVQASGRFSNNGDAQAGRYLLRTTTINNVPTEMFIDGTNGNKRLTLSDDSTWTFKVTITGHRADLGNGHAGYTASGVIYRGAGPGSTFIQGSVQKTVLAESDQQWDILVTSDSTNGSLKIMVTGENSKIIRWVALVETVEITN